MVGWGRERKRGRSSGRQVWGEREGSTNRAGKRKSERHHGRHPHSSQAFLVRELCVLPMISPRPGRSIPDAAATADDSSHSATVAEHRSLCALCLSQPYSHTPTANDYDAMPSFLQFNSPAHARCVHSAASPCQRTLIASSVLARRLHQHTSGGTLQRMAPLSRCLAVSCLHVDYPSVSLAVSPCARSSDLSANPHRTFKKGAQLSKPIQGPSPRAVVAHAVICQCCKSRAASPHSS